ncbi:lysophospholipid acyltransferase family protein [Ottowia testudinis]|uniref:1-acyl-sn-glycerol-3-phosphate acyltransferase n=1 Tax=Ottowia testudinis TaxID=2816950 RepID=A0A975CHW9_9BURK|nr:lysophospholipid acyltransferase family protein [Ottowia testudinis]QTD43693.1 1-acyl-sn-glycerol-3-phosphate acyltransferase [Ottowia testudinis]
MLKLLWRAYENVAMVVGLGLLAIICLTWTPFALLLNPLLPEARAKRIGRAAIRGGFRLYLRLLTLLCACRFEVRELQALGRRREPLVVVANHPSLLDAVILVACLPNAVCIMKARLMHNLLLGAGARMARYIVNDAPLPMIRNAIAELREGACLIIFPEGTRTVTPPVDDCASTAGMIAARAGVPVQALLMEMSTPYLGKHWPAWRPPVLPLTCRVRVGQRWDTLERPPRFGHDIEAYFQQTIDPAANRLPPGRAASPE